MDPKTEKDLQKATALFYEQRLREAHVIFKRYFDRLPFKPERGHLKYIGMFVRTLFELGKSRELEFYRSTLEKIYQDTKAPEIGYQLAYLNLDDQHQNLKVSKAILESIINEPDISEYKNKAKMLLAHCYDILHDDIASVKRIIDSIEGDLEPQTANLLVTWKAKILRDEGHFDQSKRILSQFVKDVSFEMDWYSHLTGRITLSYTLLKLGDLEGARKEIETVRVLENGKPATSIEQRLKYVEKEMDKLKAPPSITLREEKGRNQLSLNGKTHDLKKEKKTDALLLKLLKDGFVSKELAAHLLTEKKNGKEKDINQVYSGIHSVRRLLEKMGMSKDSILNAEGGYKFVPRIEFIREDV